MAETSGLLNRRTGDSRTEGSNPSVSARFGTDRPPTIALSCLSNGHDHPVVTHANTRTPLLTLDKVEQKLTKV